MVTVGAPARVRQLWTRARPLLPLIDGPEWCLVVGGPLAILLTPGIWWGALVSAVIYGTLALLVVLAAVEVRVKLASMTAGAEYLLGVTPSGAPRLMEVPCRHGDLHRFQWTGNHWEAIGPGTSEAP